MNILEKTWKNCLEMKHIARQAVCNAETLEDKLRMVKLEKMFVRCSNEIKRAYYEFEDAEKFVNNKFKMQG